MRIAAIVAAALALAPPAWAASPLDAAAPTSTTTGCNWPGGIDLPDVARAYDQLVAWWGITFGENKATRAMWDQNPLTLDPNPKSWYSKAEAYKWHYQAIAEKDALYNLEFFQWAATPGKTQYKWFEFGPKYLSDKASLAGSNIVLMVSLAHEFGHYVQAIGGRGAVKGLFPPGSDNPQAPETRDVWTIINKELDADRLAGAFMATLGVENCLTEIRALIISGSDDGKTKPDHPHGTSVERFSCFMYGYYKGVHPFYVGDTLGRDVIGMNQQKGIHDACPRADCPSGVDPRTGKPVYNPFMMKLDQTAKTDDGESCPSQPKKPEPKVGPPIVVGSGARCVSNVFERWQNCVCPPGLPVREEITGRGPDRDPQHDLIWCRRGKARM